MSCKSHTIFCVTIFVAHVLLITNKQMLPNYEFRLLNEEETWLFCPVKITMWYEKLKLLIGSRTE